MAPASDAVGTESVGQRQNFVVKPSTVFVHFANGNAEVSTLMKFPNR